MRVISLAAARRFSSRSSSSSSSLSSVVAGPRFFSSSSSSSSISRRSESPNDENADADAYDDARRRNRTRLNYTNVLLVVKETALAKYTSLADSGNQPGYDYRDKNVRWDRLKVRHEAHEKAVLKGRRRDSLSLSTREPDLFDCSLFFVYLSLSLSSFVKGCLSLSLSLLHYSLLSTRTLSTIRVSFGSSDIFERVGTRDGRAVATLARQSGFAYGEGRERERFGRRVGRRRDDVDCESLDFFFFFFFFARGRRRGKGRRRRGRGCVVVREAEIDWNKHRSGGFSAVLDVHEESGRRAAIDGLVVRGGRERRGGRVEGDFVRVVGSLAAAAARCEQRRQRK